MSVDSHAMHHDEFGAKLGMWLFLVTEIDLIWWTFYCILVHAPQISG